MSTHRAHRPPDAVPRVRSATFRRAAMGLAVLLAVGAAGSALGPRARRWLRPPPPRQAAKPEVPFSRIYQIDERLWVIPGGGGNTAVFLTAEGLVVIDPKFPEFGPQVLEEIRRVTDQPIALVITTHSHNDHFGGVLAMEKHVPVVMHERTARNIAKLRGTGNPDELDGHPVRTFDESLTLFEGPDQIELRYFGPAHTDGDIVVVIKAFGVMHAGDLFRAKRNPIINLPWGGSPSEFPVTLAHAVNGVHGVSRVITGHADVVPWQAFVEYSQFVELLVRHGRAQMDAGRTWNEAVASFAPPAPFGDYDLRTLPNTMQDIYKGETPWWKVWVR